MTRVRDFIDDLWFDLRERRLLPVLAALLAAAVAVPMILGGSSEAPLPESAEPVDVIETQPAVALRTEEQIRDAEKRLGVAKNPFRQQLRSLPERGEIEESGEVDSTSAAAQLADQLSGGSAAAPDSSPSTPTEPAEPAPDPSADVQPKTKTKVKTKTITKTIVKLEHRSLRVRFGKQGKRNKVTGLESLDQLPRHEDPVVVLLGVDRRSGEAMFDVASRVTSVWGKGKCVPSKKECDYLTLKPGESAKFRYQPRAKGAGEYAEEQDPVVYSLTVVRVSTKRVSA